MKKEYLKIEVVPVPLSDHISLGKYGLSPPLSRTSQDRENKTSELEGEVMAYKACHMFYTKSGRSIEAYELGKTALQAKKRLIRLLL